MPLSAQTEQQKSSHDVLAMVEYDRLGRNWVGEWKNVASTTPVTEISTVAAVSL